MEKSKWKLFKSPSFTLLRKGQSSEPHLHQIWVPCWVRNPWGICIYIYIRTIIIHHIFIYYHTYIYMYINICIYIYVYIYRCIYIYISISTINRFGRIPGFFFLANRQDAEIYRTWPSTAQCRSPRRWRSRTRLRRRRRDGVRMVGFTRFHGKHVRELCGHICRYYSGFIVETYRMFYKFTD